MPVADEHDRQTGPHVAIDAQNETNAGRILSHGQSRGAISREMQRSLITNDATSTGIFCRDIHMQGSGTAKFKIGGTQRWRYSGRRSANFEFCGA